MPRANSRPSGLIALADESRSHYVLDTMTCTKRTLAQSPVAHVQQCADCGCISIDVGPSTLRLAPEAFDELVATLMEASVGAPRGLRSAGVRGAA